MPQDVSLQLCKKKLTKNILIQIDYLLIPCAATVFATTANQIEGGNYRFSFFQSILSCAIFTQDKHTSQEVTCSVDSAAFCRVQKNKVDQRGTVVAVAMMKSLFLLLGQVRQVRAHILYL